MATEKTSKRSIAIRVMTENKDKPMADVVALIAKAIDVTEANAKSYYKYIVANKLGPGKVEKSTKVKAAKPAKTKEVPAKKLLKEVGLTKGNRFTGKVKTETKPKDADELAKIKAANLKRMQEITERNKVIRAQYNGNIARGADDPFDPLDFTPEGARAEVAAMLAEDEPRFLTKDQVKALV